MSTHEKEASGCLLWPGFLGPGCEKRGRQVGGSQGQYNLVDEFMVDFHLLLGVVNLNF
jgi:hypothetical protein